MKSPSVCVIGLGYIGLPTAVMFASRGIQVSGVDVNIEVVDTINEGRLHIFEPGLDVLVAEVVEKGFLVASTEPRLSDVYLIAVPTPLQSMEKGTYIPDISFVVSAVNAIAPFLKKGDLVILESTSPVGTTEFLSEKLAGVRPDLSFPKAGSSYSDVAIAYCPERVLPGRIMEELQKNDRLIGGVTSNCSRLAESIYKTFVTGDCVQTDSKTAEMAKLTENSFRDVQIAFANELSVLCDELNINVWELIALANRHPRVNILNPGPGVGGHCIAVDPWFVIAKSPDSAHLIRAARAVNLAKVDWVLNKLDLYVKDFGFSSSQKDSDRPLIACYGLAYKANIDDLRESPALEIARKLERKYPGRVIAVEPNVKELNAKYDFPLVTLEYAIAHADIDVILVDHEEFRCFRGSERPWVLDTRGVCEIR